MGCFHNHKTDLTNFLLRLPTFEGKDTEGDGIGYVFRRQLAVGNGQSAVGSRQLARGRRQVAVGKWHLLSSRRQGQLEGCDVLLRVINIKGKNCLRHGAAGGWAGQGWMLIFDLLLLGFNCFII